MRQLRSPDGNIFGLLDGRSLDSHELPFPLLERHPRRAMQTHSSLVQRLALDKVMEGHQGCVNALSWNAKGSLLLSGSDDTVVNVWDYSTRKLVHSIHTGHTANIFCTKFMPETGDSVIVSGAGDNEVRVHRITRSSARPGLDNVDHKDTALFRCHSRRVKKLAVEDGNPHVVWSASEDATLRQHDLRECNSCPSGSHECRNVLLDLRNGAKRTLLNAPRHPLALKTCAVSPTRPHHLLIGGSDAFARLYDRRMLLPPSSDRQNAKTPPCVCYFCPAHLSDDSRSNLHLTHVTFSPNGEEVLLSYSGEHVYLMAANSAQHDAVVYTASDLPKRSLLSPLSNGTGEAAAGVAGLGRRRDSAWLKECWELFEDARRAMQVGRLGNCLYVIEATSEVIDGGGPVVGPELRHNCLCLRATAFLKRAWKNDVHMTIRDSDEARAIIPDSVIAHYNLSKAFSQLQKPTEALEFALRAHQLDPSDSGLNDLVAQLRSTVQAEEARNGESDGKSDRRSSRSRPRRDRYFRPISGDSERVTDNTEELDIDEESDMEMEMEIEMSVDIDQNRNRNGGRAGPSVNLRLKQTRRAPTPSSVTDVLDNTSFPDEVVVDMRQRYVGHCNTGTDIKQASFLGERGEFIGSGSDGGRWFIWQKRTGRLVKVLTGDEHVVNCVQSHPLDCAIATSGIDSTIKLWTPCAEEASMVAGGVADPEIADVPELMAENQRQMKHSGELTMLRWNTLLVLWCFCDLAIGMVCRPLELLQRFRVQNGLEGGGHPFECTPS